MKRTFVWALMAMILVAGSAFAARPNVVVPDATFPTGSPATTNNDDSCDIGVAPAATLLLPYFEVAIGEPQTTARTTLFTITNTSRLPQIAHVTLWTDWSFPVLDFNIFLTGYDVQGINLYDVIARGVVAPTAGTSNATTPGTRSASNLTGNPNFLPSAASFCGPATNIPNIPLDLLADVQSGLTTGLYPGGCTPASARVGATHTSGNAIGYVTIDVAATCSQSLPITSTYYSSEILFDNVLIGDYQQIDPNPATGNFAGGNPLVHIRAIPEGGPAGLLAPPGGLPTNLPYTFYDRYTPTATRRIDRRQPLPALWAARFINGGTGQFNTNWKIWREGITRSDNITTTCAAYGANAFLSVADVVRFDERENATTLAGAPGFSPVREGEFSLPETSSISSANTALPRFSTSGDLGGWMYWNLDNLAPVGVYSTVRASQNWVIVSMAAQGLFAVDFDAAWLGNGCSAPAATGATVGPAPNITP